MSDGQVRVYCPVCQAGFRFIDGWREGYVVVCPICGQRLTLRQGADGWTGDRVDSGTEREIRDRVENFAELRGYRFSELKEEMIEGLLGKQKLFGDFYCPCRMMHTPEYQCPCKPTRGGDVEKDGRCYCGFFLR
ncbi:MAG: ferredoxin-thioredoxin reductase catalytic domain-containing protein [Thermoplasmata archaeon]